MQQGTFMRWFLTWFVVWLLAAVVLLCLGAGIRAAAATGMAQGACATEPRFAAPSVLKLIHHSDAASRIILRVVLKPVVLWFAPAPADAVAAEEASGTARDPSYCVLLALCIDLVNGIDLDRTQFGPLHPIQRLLKLRVQALERLGRQARAHRRPMSIA